MSRSVLWLAPHFRTGSQAGGLRTWVLAKHLAAEGYQVTVTIPNWDPLTGKKLVESRRLATPVEVDGVELLHLWSTRNDRSNVLRRIAYFVSQSLAALLVAVTRRRPDVVLAANYPPTLAMVGLLLSLLFRRPFVLEVRDLPAEAAVASGYVSGNRLGRIALAMERFLLRSAKYIVTVAPGMRRRMIELGVKPEAIRVVPNGYEESIFEAAWRSGRDVRTEHGWGDRFVVLYAGTMGHIPDLMTLLRAAVLTRGDEGIRYVLIGGGQREQEYIEFARRNDLESCEFLGRRPRSEMPLYCQAADVCVNLFPKNPFWGTILGNKTFDYLGSGTAYVYCGSEPSDTGDVLRAARAGLVVEAEDAEGLRDAILYLRDHPAEREAMGERGRLYVTEQFSRSKIDREFESAVAEAIGRAAWESR